MQTVMSITPLVALQSESNNPNQDHASIANDTAAAPLF